MLPKKWWQFLILTGIILGLVATALVALAATLIYPELPSLDALTDYKPKVPMRVYSADGYLIGEFGEERRAFISINDTPTILKQAILAAEDERFYQHGGIDTLGILRAAVSNVISGSFKEGASTITMQVARNFFLSREKTATRKLSEALLSIKIEHSLTKDQILELYINQIYLGHRSYGFAAASQVYYGKPLNELSIAEAAMLAGLPKAPSRYNPFANIKRSEARQHYVLRRMKELHFIDQKQYDAAYNEPHHLRQSRKIRELSADYVAEIVRQAMYERYKNDIYSSGLKIYTTIRKSDQEAANRAILQGIIDYDRRHGYRGPEKTVTPGANPTGNGTWLDNALDALETFQGMVPAVVTDASPKAVSVYSKDGNNIEISGDGLAFVKKQLNDKDAAKRTIKPGAVIRIMRQKDAWHIVQLPQAEAALVSLDTENGAVRALVGGFDFNRNKFNHVTQAWRQPGSSFKPFIYSASLEKGFTPATMIEDEPISISARETGSGSSWQPKNYDRKYDGPMRVRTALTKSKNMVSIRILEGIGVNYAQDYITRFGFSPKDHPPYLAMALGSGSVTAWQMAGAYAVFANGGYRVKPYIIDKVVDPRGKVVEQSKPLLAGQGAPRVIDGRNAFIMNSMLRDVVRIGTASKARALGRSDLAGKTGTTNNQIDAWFAGYNPKQVAIAWMGYDKPKSLGSLETGGKAALPIWVDYMSSALKGTPNVTPTMPDGISAIRINPETGMRSTDDSGVVEYFYQEFPPPEPEEPAFSIIPGFPIPGHGATVPMEKKDSAPQGPDQLF
ncbi:penicillin-binding protein 1A [Methylobacillus rhizosphaerae]|uniref:Penicillin-binding protein 1A n=1 Tax=Methylobacillus rhizosphaerae TaxID=551994 RepID=A0A238XT92_9PROT|nr:penicillin-binding protein 1A [Methylobacillus rhizosphaerae]SNR61788.1 penicillin-binding protein 1A [Methylobacillus rhizosphaerae]